MSLEGRKPTDEVQAVGGEEVFHPTHDRGKRSALRHVVRWILGLLLATLALWVLTQGLAWSAIANALRRANYAWVGIATTAVVATILTRALRWQALLDGQQPRPDESDVISLRSAVAAILVGQAVNTGLPMLRSGDFARAIWTSQRGAVGVTQSLGSIVVEKVWDLLALCVTGLGLLLLIPLPAWFRQSTLGVMVAVGAGIVVLWAGLRWQTSLLAMAGRLIRALPERLSAFLLPQLHALVQALDTIRQPQASAVVGAWTAVTWILGGLINWTVMRAFGIRSTSGAVLLLATLMLGSSVVPVPGYIGVFEGITVVSLAQFDVAPNLALAVGLVLHLVVVGPSLLFAALVGLANSFGLLRTSREPAAACLSCRPQETSKTTLPGARQDDL